jgi:hypothetical protein
MKITLLVQDIDFNFDYWEEGEEPPSLTEDEYEELFNQYINKIYEIEIDDLVDIDDAIMDVITDCSGWFINDISYRIINDDYPHQVFLPSSIKAKTTVISKSAIIKKNTAS